jgi:hypothetical protein
MESRRPKVAQWRPPASKSHIAKSFVFGQNVRTRLIFLKWHGRGREFESHQVHQMYKKARVVHPRTETACLRMAVQ